MFFNADHVDFKELYLCCPLVVMKSERSNHYQQRSTWKQPHSCHSCESSRPWVVMSWGSGMEQLGICPTLVSSKWSGMFLSSNVCLPLEKAGQWQGNPQPRCLCQSTQCSNVINDLQSSHGSVTFLGAAGPATCSLVTSSHLLSNGHHAKSFTYCLLLQSK